MKLKSTLLLRIAICIITAPVIVLAVLGIWWIMNNPANPDYSYMLYPILVGIYLSVIPFFIALLQTFKLLKYIDSNQVFSELSVKVLTNIKYCAISISMIYLSIIPFVYMLAEKDDAPGLIIIGIVPSFAAIIIATFTAVLQNLLKKAIDIKSENDLTI